MGELSNFSSKTVAASEMIARKMSQEKIEHYLKIAQETVNKSFSAILIGTLIATLGLTLQYLLNLALANDLLQPNLPISRLWLARVLFASIGAYLVIQGLLCLVEARTQSAVMSKALQLKRRESL